MTIRSVGAIGFWVVLCALLSPLWPVGAALSFLHRVVAASTAAIIRWGFWEPTQAAWGHLVRSYRVASAESSPEVADEVERQRKVKDFLRRARRARGGR